MSRIVLVRHGATVWHGENRYAGSSDIELTERGREQARDLASWAVHGDISQVYVSPLGRAQTTARPVAAALGLSPVIDNRLRELDFGEGEGLTSREMRERFPQQYDDFCRNPVEHHLPGGEDPRAAIARGRGALDAIAAETDSRARVLVVTHNTLIRLLLCDLLGIPPCRYRQVFPSLGNVSMTEIVHDEKATALLHFNSPIAGVQS